jgi:hypothetical protein
MIRIASYNVFFNVFRYIVTGYAGRNLRNMLEHREFTDPEICYLVHQMLRGLRVCFKNTVNFQYSDTLGGR